MLNFNKNNIILKNKDFQYIKTILIIFKNDIKNNLNCCYAKQYKIKSKMYKC